MRSHATVSVAAFFLCILLMKAGAQIAPRDGWYSSDAAGLALESISDPVGFEYTLRVQTQDETVRSELFHNGESVKSWLKTYGSSGLLSREVMEKDGLLKEEFLYDQQGRPHRERIFLDGGEIEETAYEYASGRLVSRITTRSGMTISTRTYLYTPDGRLAVFREASESGTESGASTAPSGGSSSWRIEEHGLEVRSYDATGHLVSSSMYNGTERVSHEVRSWKDGVLAQVTVETADGLITSLEYVLAGPALGNVAVITIQHRDAADSTELRTYDEKGRLSRVQKNQDTGESVVVHEYGDDDALVSTRTSIGGKLVSLIRYEAPTVWIEELYDSGTVFARVWYNDGRRVLEEMLRDGVVIRTRRFP